MGPSSGSGTAVLSVSAWPHARRRRRGLPSGARSGHAELPPPGRHGPGSARRAGVEQQQAVLCAGERPREPPCQRPPSACGLQARRAVAASRYAAPGRGARQAASGWPDSDGQPVEWSQGHGGQRAVVGASGVRQRVALGCDQVDEHLPDPCVGQADAVQELRGGAQQPACASRGNGARTMGSWRELKAIRPSASSSWSLPAAAAGAW